MLYLWFPDNFCALESAPQVKAPLPLGAILSPETLTTEIVREGYLFPAMI